MAVVTASPRTSHLLAIGLGVMAVTVKGLPGSGSPNSEMEIESVHHCKHASTSPADKRGLRCGLWCLERSHGPDGDRVCTPLQACIDLTGRQERIAVWIVVS